MTTLFSADQLAVGGVDLEQALAAKITAKLTASTTWDPPSLAAGAYTTQSFTVTGAAAGDIVLVSHANISADTTLSAVVTAADTVIAQLKNNSAGTVNISAGAIRFIVL